MKKHGPASGEQLGKDVSVELHWSENVTLDATGVEGSTHGFWDEAFRVIMDRCDMGPEALKRRLRIEGCAHAKEVAERVMGWQKPLEG